MFTKEQIEEIRQKIAETFKKDTDFPWADLPLNGTEKVAIIQDNKNKLVNIDDLFLTTGFYTLTVTSTPSDATIKLNGAVQNTISVKPNTVVSVEVSKEGYKTVTDSVTVTSNGQVVSYTLPVDKSSDDTPEPVVQDYITLSPAEFSLATGAKQTIAVIPSSSAVDLTDLVWSSSNPSVATVDSNGIVTGKRAGSVVITATTKDGHSSQASGVVSSSVVKAVYLTLQTEDVAAGTAIEIPTMRTRKTCTLIPAIYPAEAEGRTVIWQSTNTAVLSVTDDGVVTTTGEGNAVIVATVDGVSATASFIVSNAIETVPVYIYVNGEGMNYGVFNEDVIVQKMFLKLTYPDYASDFKPEFYVRVVGEGTAYEEGASEYGYRYDQYGQYVFDYPGSVCANLPVGTVVSARVYPLQDFQHGSIQTTVTSDLDKYGKFVININLNALESSFTMEATSSSQESNSGVIGDNLYMCGGDTYSIKKDDGSYTCPIYTIGTGSRMHLHYTAKKDGSDVKAVAFYSADVTSLIGSTIDVDSLDFGEACSTPQDIMLFGIGSTGAGDNTSFVNDNDQQIFPFISGDTTGYVMIKCLWATGDASYVIIHVSSFVAVTGYELAQNTPQVVELNREVVGTYSGDNLSDAGKADSCYLVLKALPEGKPGNGLATQVGFRYELTEGSDVVKTDTGVAPIVRTYGGYYRKSDDASVYPLPMDSVCYGGPELNIHTEGKDHDHPTNLGTYYLTVIDKKNSSVQFTFTIKVKDK